jgi:hypothetical protein
LIRFGAKGTLAMRNDARRIFCGQGADCEQYNSPQYSHFQIRR